MTFLTTLDVSDLTPDEYRAILDEMGVETRPAAGIYLHLTGSTDFGYRILEIWDSREGFESFLQQRLGPATKKLGIERKTIITVVPLHNLFAPRLDELRALVPALPGSLGRDPSSH